MPRDIFGKGFEMKLSEAFYVHKSSLLKKINHDLLKTDSEADKVLNRFNVLD